MSTPILNALKTGILPKHYRKELSDRVGHGSLLFKKGPYVCLVMPFDKIPPHDFGSNTAKATIRKAMTCFPVFLEKGLFLIYYGPSNSWSGSVSKFRVDKTALLRLVILQSIHFIDPVTGENVNSRTHWGPLKFGFCGKLIEDIESMCKGIQQGGAPDAYGAGDL